MSYRLHPSSPPLALSPPNPAAAATVTATATADSSPTPPRPSPPVHKRTYQACQPCRQRKVRCDLGSVEAPHDPPCVRCRRESKDCYFSATRRKRTPSVEVPPGMGRGRGVVRKVDEDPQSGGDFKRVRTVDEPPYSPSRYRPPLPQDLPSIDPRLKPQHAPRYQQLSPLRPPPPPPPPQPSATSADTLLQTEVYNSHEALLTLIEAAGKDTPLSTSKSEEESPTTESSDSVHHSLKDSTGNRSHMHSPAATSHWNQNAQFSSVQSEESKRGKSSAGGQVYRKTGIPSLISPKGQTPRVLSGSVIVPDDGMERALRGWNKFRFVKAGWFTSREAVAYVEYFYHHLHPLSPTLTSPTLLHVSHPRHHPLLLRYEPFLTTTILTVASRYMTLPGPGGQSRSYAIHDMLWREVRGGFERLTWGGGWGGLGVPRQGVSGFSSATTNAPNGARVGRGLRTLGTVEGLLILTEWHVRGLHFPMDVEESDWGIELSDDEGTLESKPVDSGKVVEGLGDRIENILEPAYRSDRMSWMLLGNALALAYELGVFDELDDSTPATSEPPAPREPGDTPFRTRAQRIQKLLLVYVLHLASRLGWTSMIPKHITHNVRRRIPPVTPPGTWASEDELQDVIFSSWVDLTLLMKSSSELLFPSRAITKNIMRSGRYVTLLEHFQPLLRSWRREFDALRLPPPIYHILVLEYEHVRFYINSLALQAVVDRCSLRSPAPQNLTALWEMSPQDTAFIKEVVDASRTLLSTVVKDMFPAGYLKHAPVRIYLRILSAAMFLLKTFALGAKEEEVKTSMELIESTVNCLRSAAVDDVSLGLRFAELLGGLAGRVRGRFVRMPRSRAGTPLMAPAAMDTAEDRGGGSGRTGADDGNMDGMRSSDGGSYTVQDDMHSGYSEMQGQWASGYEDWLALPLDPIVDFGGSTQDTMSINMGGIDLLQMLLRSNYSYEPFS